MKTEITIDPEAGTFQGKREFAADVNLVWRAWTEAELLDQWWAPKPWKTETVSMDFRPFGSWIYEMVGPEGERHANLRVYQKIRKHESFTGMDAFSDRKGNDNEEILVGTWKNTFRRTAGGTEVISFVEYSSRKALETVVSMGMAEGLDMAQNNLDELLKTIQ